MRTPSRAPWESLNGKSPRTRGAAAAPPPAGSADAAGDAIAAAVDLDELRELAAAGAPIVALLERAWWLAFGTPARLSRRRWAGDLEAAAVRADRATGEVGSLACRLLDVIEQDAAEDRERGQLAARPHSLAGYLGLAKWTARRWRRAARRQKRAAAAAAAENEPVGGALAPSDEQPRPIAPPETGPWWLG